MKSWCQTFILFVSKSNNTELHVNFQPTNSKLPMAFSGLSGFMGCLWCTLLYELVIGIKVAPRMLNVFD